MLNKQPIQVPLTAGADAGDVDPTMPHNTVLKAENVVYDRQGTLQRRKGTTALTGTFASDTNLANLSERPVLYGDSLYLRDTDSETSGGWRSVGAVDLHLAELQALSNGNGYNVLHCDVVNNESTGIRTYVEVRENPDGNYFMYIGTVRTATGALIAESTINSSALGTWPMMRVAVRDGDTTVFFMESGSLKRIEVDSAGAIGSSSTIATADPENLDIAVIGTDTFLAYTQSSGATVSLGKLTSGNVWTTTNVDTGRTSANPCLSIGGDMANKLIVTYSHDLGASTWRVSLRAYDTSLTASFASQTMHTGAANEFYGNTTTVTNASGDLFVYANVNDQSGSGNYDNVRIGVILSAFTAPSVVTMVDFLGNAKLAAHAITPYDGTWKVPLFIAGPGQADSSFVVIDDNTGTGHIMLCTFGQATAQTRTYLSNWQQLADGSFLFAAGFRSNVDTGIAKAVALSAGQRGNAHELDGSLHIANGTPLTFDGRDLFEIGFATRPSLLATVATSGGFAYGYQVVYEHIDAQGRVHQSAPSDVVTVEPNSAITTDNATLTIENLPVTRRSGVRIAIYRTENGGNVFYRVAHIDNDKTVATSTYTDSLADSTLIANEQLYTSRGLVENIAPPSTRVTCVHQGRHFAVPRENESQLIRYSKVLEKGSGLEHSDSLTIPIDPTGGRMTALASMHDKLVIFKAGRIYATQGQGLNADAVTGLPYAEPYLVAPDIGCIAPQELVEIPDGILFRSSKGIKLLDRALRIHDVGDAVRYYTTQATDNGYEGTAVTIPGTSVAVWLFNNAAVPALVYSYRHRKWSTWTAHNANGACVSNGRLHFHNLSDATVVRNDAYDDSGSAIAMTVETRFLPVGPLGGEGRVYNAVLLGQQRAQSRISMQAQYDYDPEWDTAQTQTLTTYIDDSDYLEAGSTSGAYDDDALLLKYATRRRRCSSVRFRIKCDGGAFAGAETQGATFSALTMIVGVKPKRLAAAGGRDLS